MPVFTTRPDTLFGATFFVLAPEHELVERLADAAENADEIREYVRRAAAKKTEERAAAKEKTGVFTGFHVVNPVNGERMPMYVADYVLTDYGTGAIMAVPAHDERDFDVRTDVRAATCAVIRPRDGEVDEGAPYVAHSRERGARQLGRVRRAARAGGRPADRRAAGGGRKRQVRDQLPPPRLGLVAPALLGLPDPGRVLREATGSSRCPTSELPVVLPEVEDYRPKGKPPLAQAEDWVNVPCPRCGEPAKRETETMDTFVDSSWYFLRYCDPHDEQAPFDRAIVDYWNPVDLYIGGVDHATMHMIYARYWSRS